MKTQLCIVIFLLAAATLPAQTNNLTALLQQGLFEEQANRNLDAAIADYQTLALQFDKDRQLAATAMFRLGECYRAQGRTNEAAAQYQRILRDFSDQQTLATLSRQDLTGMGMVAPETALAGQTLGENSDVRLWNRLKDVPKSDLAKVLPTLVPDATLDALLKQRDEAEAKLAELKIEFAPGTPDYQKQSALLAAINHQMDERINGMMEALKLRSELSQSGPNAGNSPKAAGPNGAVTSAEDQEIQRIQQMIQNSPDLINVSDFSFGTPLVKAAYSGQFKVAAYLLDHGADINTPASDVRQSKDLMDAGQVTPLVAAVLSGDKAMTKFLIDHGADINFKDRRGDTPLHLAARKGFQAVTEVLLAGHAGVNFKDQNGDTPLHLAARNGFQAVAEGLLDSHADVNVQNNDGAAPLFDAVESGRMKIIQMLLAAGANVNLKDNKDRTVLNYAVSMSPEIMQTLLTAGTNPNTEDSNGRTPLSYAVEKDNSDVAKQLLTAKADPNLGTLDTPLLCAIHNHDAATTELLVHYGANPNLMGRTTYSDVTIKGSTYMGGPTPPVSPVFLAVSEKQLPLVQLLLKYKADPNDSQTDGQSVLFSALDKPDIAKALLDAGASAEATNAPSGSRWPYVAETLLREAVFRDQEEAVSLLLQHGADPDAKDANGNSPLHFATFNRWDEEIFTVLLDHKANPNVRNNDGKTPLDYIIQGLRNDSYVGSFGNLDAKKAMANKLIALLHQHGALDQLPDWDHIRFSRPTANYSVPVFSKNTNDWNHFTLLEGLYESAGLVSQSGPLAYPDLAHIIITRPATDGVAVKRVTVNLLDASNHLDCTRDVPLEFGDVVEIPEREHSLAERAVYLSSDQAMRLLNYFRDQAGEAKLIVAGGQTVQLPLQPFHSQISEVLQYGNARAALTSSSDLSRVNVTRHDPKTGKTDKWILDCSNQNNKGMPDLWVRAGDVIEVPLKP